MQTDKEYAFQLAMEYGFTGGFDAQGNLTYDCSFVEAVLEATAKEREACAKLCAEDKNQAMDWMGTAYVGKHYADLIRARGEPTLRGEA